MTIETALAELVRVNRYLHIAIVLGQGKACCQESDELVQYILDRVGGVDRTNPLTKLFATAIMEHSVTEKDWLNLHICTFCQRDLDEETHTHDCITHLASQFLLSATAATDFANLTTKDDC